MYRVSTKQVNRQASPVKMNKDILCHVLYDDDIELIRDLTLPAAQRSEEESSGSSEIVYYVQKCRNLSVMRALFFILLNVDSQLREDVVSSQFCNEVWTRHGKPVPMCPYKATRFFKTMQNECIHTWMRDERCTAAQMVHNIRSLYICS
jgi:hypothetical protein